MYAEAWAAKPDVCRCCLSAKGVWDLTTPEERGIEGTFADALTAVFGISLSHLSKPDASHIVCRTCVKLLRSAYNFRRQVVTAEDNYVRCYIKRKGVAEDMKLEDDGDDDDFQNFEHHLGQSTSVSDTPLAADSVEFLNFNNIINQHEPNEPPVNVVAKKPPEAPKPDRKMSERKRVVLTCEVVLRETTACPFRHFKSWFQCFFCPQEFIDMTSLRTHTLAAHADIDAELLKLKHYPRSLQIDISILECRQCHLSLTDVESMRRHFETAHGKIIYKESIADYKVDCTPYTCHLCNEVFHVFRTLTTHLNEHYANCICDVCGRGFINSKRLKVHKRSHVDGQFPCAECGKILKNKTSQVNHMESAHCKRQLKCQICAKPMKHYNERIKHMSEAHNITHVFKCKICFKEYNIKQYLATHMRQTHGNKTKKCAECGMVFITNHGLKKHMAKHTGARPHACAACGRAYARAHSLREHVRARHCPRD